MSQSFTCLIFQKLLGVPPLNQLLVTSSKKKILSLAGPKVLDSEQSWNYPRFPNQQWRVLCGRWDGVHSLLIVVSDHALRPKPCRPCFSGRVCFGNPGHSKPQIVFNFMSCPSYSHDIQLHTWMILSKYQKMKTVLKIRSRWKNKHKRLKCDWVIFCFTKQV